jgi:E3 ubiquitin-protein ligase SHPRH
MINTSQIMQYNEDLDQREERCLEILLRAEKEADEVIWDVLSAIAEHDTYGDKLKAEAASVRAARSERQTPEHERKGQPGAVEDGRGVEDDRSTFGDNESDYGGLPKTPAGEEHLHRSRALQQRLRDCYLTLHRVKFLQGDAYHWMGELKAAEEAAAYKVADGLRSKMLKCVFFSSYIHQTFSLKHFFGSHGRISYESDGTTSDRCREKEAR